MNLRITRFAGALALVTALAACTPSTGTDGAADDSGTAGVTGDSALVVEDSWVKAVEQSDGMTGAFATITNPGEEDAHVVAISSPGAGRAELHETVAGDGGAMVMQEMSDGFTVPAGESHELVPGGDHLMLMELQQDVLAGDDVEITLELEGGETVMFTAAGRTFSGANEKYDSHGEGGDQDMDQDRDMDKGISDEDSQD